MSSRKKTGFLLGFIALTTFITLFSTQPALAAPITNFPVTVKQPDGTELHLFVSGDEFYNWLHNEQGYTILQDPDTGYYVYAQLIKNQLAPTSLVVGVADPGKAGLRPDLNISPEQRENIRQEFLDNTQRDAGEISNAPQT